MERGKGSEGIPVGKTKVELYRGRTDISYREEGKWLLNSYT